MKKYLSVLAVVALASSALAQGTINFASPASSILVKSNGASAAVNVPANSSYLALLWAAPGTAASAYTGGSLASWLSANPGWAQVPNVAKPVTLAGRLLGSVVDVPNANPMDLITIGWIGGAGSTFDAAFGAGLPVGMSGKYGPIDPEAPGSTTPSPSTVGAGFTGLTLTATAVPEPSTFALAGLGAAALLIFRRRK